MFRYPVVSPANECANGSRRSIENGYSIFFDDSPKPIRLRPVRRAFVHHDGSAIRQWAVDDVAMAGHPADVRGAPIDIFIANIEYVLCRRIHADEIATGRV